MKMYEFKIGEFVEYKPKKEVARVGFKEIESFDKRPAGFFQTIPIVFKSGAEECVAPGTLEKCSESWYNASSFTRWLRRLFKFRVYK